MRISYIKENIDLLRKLEHDLVFSGHCNKTVTNNAIKFILRQAMFAMNMFNKTIHTSTIHAGLNGSIDILIRTKDFICLIVIPKNITDLCTLTLFEWNSDSYQQSTFYFDTTHKFTCLIIWN